ncbi:MAG: hypothetical protein WC255_05570 [Bacteroidales bacterium]|jgi:pseudo-rSAM protein
MSGVFDFQLSPYVYPFVKNNNVLLLNTKDMNAMIFNEEEHVAAFMRELLSPSSFGVLRVDTSTEQYKHCKHFIDKVCKLGNGLFTEVRAGSGIVPVLNPYLLKIRTPAPGAERGTNITLVLNHECFHNCSHCTDYARQFTSCTKRNSHAVMNPELVRSLLNYYNSSDHFSIDICGGDLALHPRLDEIVDILSPVEGICRYHIHYRQFKNNINRLPEQAGKIIIVDFPVADSSCFENPQKYTYNFVVSKKEDLTLCRDYVMTHSIPNFYISIMDAGRSNGFMKESIFLLQDGLECSLGSFSFKDKVRIINSHYFHKTFIMPNGDVYSSAKGGPVANLYHDAYLHVKEFVQNMHTQSWEAARNREGNSNVCTDCLFYEMCPGWW